MHSQSTEETEVSVGKDSQLKLLGGDRSEGGWGEKSIEVGTLFR